jgi:hypothetical protein
MDFKFSFYGLKLEANHLNEKSYTKTILLVVFIVIIFSIFFFIGQSLVALLF